MEMDLSLVVLMIPLSTIFILISFRKFVNKDQESKAIHCLRGQESQPPEYGNAILSKWPIKRWKVQKIAADDDDFRNVLKATIDVPRAGEINFHSTQLDHLDENWRMKQVNAIIDPPDHILARGLNSLYGADYSSERWTDMVKYYEKLGPKTEVINFMKSKDCIDAKDYGGEYEPIVIIAKGQNVQGTCKYGTRADYVLATPNSPYKFVPGSYSVISSKGTSDDHLVKADIMKVNTSARKKCHQALQETKAEGFEKNTTLFCNRCMGINPASQTTCVIEVIMYI